MMTVHEVSKLCGVSVRTLQYYDSIGLLCPGARSEAGYRLYGDSELARLQQILLFRELEFPLREIRALLAREEFDRELALEQQIALLEMKREHIENLILLARGLQHNGGQPMDFSAFDTAKMDAYTEEAKAQWGGTAAYAQYAQKSAGRSRQTEAALGKGLMTIFADFGKIKGSAPDSPQAQALCARLQSYITEHYYDCTREVLAALGAMYAAGDFAQNIDAVGGAGTAQFAADAVAFYCHR